MFYLHNASGKEKFTNHKLGKTLQKKEKHNCELMFFKLLRLTQIRQMVITSFKWRSCSPSLCLSLSSFRVYLNLLVLNYIFKVIISLPILIFLLTANDHLPTVVPFFFPTQECHMANAPPLSWETDEGKRGWRAMTDKKEGAEEVCVFNCCSASSRLWKLQLSFFFCLSLCSLSSQKRKFCRLFFLCPHLQTPPLHLQVRCWANSTSSFSFHWGTSAAIPLVLFYRFLEKWGLRCWLSGPGWAFVVFLSKLKKLWRSSSCQESKLGWWNSGHRSETGTERTLKCQTSQLKLQ